MPKLNRFATPANLPDRHSQDWSDRVAAMLGEYVGRFPQFYDPVTENTPAAAAAPMISWAAFPAALRVVEPEQRKRWKLADSGRDLQDEYCEWSTERNAAGKIVRIVFTTELPEYWEHLFRTDPNRLLALYRKLVDPRVTLPDLRTPAGNYRPRNKWNEVKPGRLTHLVQANNTLGAAIDLVARATVQRVRNGKPVTEQQALVTCAQLGNPLRNSDPQIAAAVNEATRSGARICFADPVGLYLGRPLTAAMTTPDGADPAAFWRIERGDAKHTLRARFEVPVSKPYEVGDLTIAGRPIEFGSQVAELVKVWVSVRVKPGAQVPRPKPCGRA